MCNVNTDISNVIQQKNVDEFLDIEKQQNKTETWSRLSRTIKIQLLQQFSEKYGKEHTYSISQIKQLKNFLRDALDTKKISKTKDVTYDQNKQEIINVPNLLFNPINKSFTLKHNDRPSTLKSLTPRNMTKPV